MQNTGPSAVLHTNFHVQDYKLFCEEKKAQSKDTKHHKDQNFLSVWIPLDELKGVTIETGMWKGVSKPTLNKGSKHHEGKLLKKHFHE